MSEVEGCFGSWAGGWVRFTDHDGRFGSARLGSLGWVGYAAVEVDARVVLVLI